MPEFTYRGARALTILHEKELYKFVTTWKKAKAAGVVLPESKKPDYQSMDTLLHHVFFWAREYMIWMCEKLQLPDPQIPPLPDAQAIEAEIDQYMVPFFAQYAKPLIGLPVKVFYFPTYQTTWKVDYCIDSMLEHLVVHAMRHAFQLEELMS